MDTKPLPENTFKPNIGLNPDLPSSARNIGKPEAHPLEGSSKSTSKHTNLESLGNMGYKFPNNEHQKAELRDLEKKPESHLADTFNHNMKEDGKIDGSLSASPTLSPLNIEIEKSPDFEAPRNKADLEKT